MSDVFDDRIPATPARELEPLVMVLSEDEKQTVSRHTFPSLTIDIQRDYAEFYKIPNASSLSADEISRLLWDEGVSSIPLHPKHVLIDGDLGQQIIRRQDAEPLEDTQPHNDLQTRIHKTKLEASTLFKVQETKLQEILTSIKNIVGPRVAKWIDEDVAASMKAGKLVLRDFSVLDAQFSHSNDDHGGPSGSGRDGGEGNGEGSGRANSDHKGKRKIREASHPTTSCLFNPSAFPRVRPPPPPPQQPHKTIARPLKRDTMRIRTNPDTGEPEIFDYETTQEYRTRDRTDFEIMSEFDGPHFKFDRDAWRSFEDHTLMS